MLTTTTAAGALKYHQGQPVSRNTKRAVNDTTMMPAQPLAQALCHNERVRSDDTPKP